MTDSRRDKVEKSYNLHLLDALDCDPDTGMPVLKRVEVAPPDTLVAFNARTHSTGESTGTRFWLNDYRFENTWRDPLRYVPMLDKSHCVIEPDFSVYVNMPEPMQRWNVFRGRAVNRIWSDAGLCVVPKLTWGFEESYRFCFEGISEGGAVALSTVGLAKSAYWVDFFQKGASASVSAVNPSVILAYGKPLDFDSGDASVVWYPSEIQQRFSEMKAARMTAENDEQKEG